MTLGLSAVIVLILSSCASPQPARTHVAAPGHAQEIRYVSSDFRFVMVFSEGRARSGGILALSPGILPSFPAVDVQTSDHVQCVSMGPPGNTVEFAIRRPISAGDRYTCGNTSFRVTRCFEDCRSAVIEVDVPLTGGSDRGTRKAYMFVDRCLGLLGYSDTGNLAEAIPLDAAWLRGNVGILADSRYPECDSITATAH